MRRFLLLGLVFWVATVRRRGSVLQAHGLSPSRETSKPKKSTRNKSTNRLPRVWLGDDVSAAAEWALTEPQVHYLTRSMRLRSGDAVRCFGAAAGEHVATLETVVVDGAQRRSFKLRRAETLRDPLLLLESPLPPFELIFAPLKRKRAATLVEKATELGVTALRPVVTEFTEKNALEALRAAGATAVEAAEQSERLDVPRLFDAVALKDFRTDLPVYACVERADGEAPHLLAALERHPKHTQGFALLVGPEGGFSEADRAALAKAIPNLTLVTIGPFILRAETAAIAALAIAHPFR